MTSDIPIAKTPTRPATYYAVLIVLVAATFAPTLTFDFVDYDDLSLVVQNPLLHPPTAEHLKMIWSGPYQELYAPLSYTVWWLVALTGTSGAAAFHALNIALHLIAAALVFSILRFCVKRDLPAFAGALLFAIHPLQVESVAWIAEMNNLLAGVLSLAAIRLYLASVAPPRLARYFASMLIFALALLAKPTAIVAPFIAMALDIAVNRRPIFRVIGSVIPWLILDIPMGLLTAGAQAGWPSPAAHRPIIAMDALGFYLWKIVWPIHLTIDYFRTPQRVWDDQLWFYTAGAAGLIAIILIAIHRRAQVWAAAGFIFLIALSPVLGIVPFSLQRWSTVNDHFVYLAMLGPALAITQIRAPRVMIAIAILLLIPCELRINDWYNTQTLADAAIRLDPETTIGNKIKGADLARQSRWPEAIPCYRTALIRHPLDGDIHYNLANALHQTGDLDSAIAEYQIAAPLVLPSQRVTVLLTLGVALQESGQADIAKQIFAQVLQLDANNAFAIKKLDEMNAGNVRTP